MGVRDVWREVLEFLRDGFARLGILTSSCQATASRFQSSVFRLANKRRCTERKLWATQKIPFPLYCTLWTRHNVGRQDIIVNIILCRPLLRCPRLWISKGVIAGARKGFGPMMWLFLTDDRYIFPFPLHVRRTAFGTMSFAGTSWEGQLPQQRHRNRFPIFSIFPPSAPTSVLISMAGLRQGQSQHLSHEPAGIFLPLSYNSKHKHPFVVLTS